MRKHFIHTLFFAYILHISRTCCYNHGNKAVSFVYYDCKQKQTQTTKLQNINQRSDAI